MRHRTAINDALVELDRRLQAARFRISQGICATMRPRYDALVSDMVEKLLALRESAVEYAEFADALTAENVAWAGHLVPKHMRLLGDLRGHSSKIAWWLREAVAARALGCNLRRRPGARMCQRSAGA